MSKIKSGGLDQYGTEAVWYSSNLEQWALKGLNIIETLTPMAQYLFSRLCSTAFSAPVLFFLAS